MKEFHITLLLLFCELCTLQGHVISKREAADVDRYIVKSDKDTIEIINPKAKKPTLREIIFYHVIEKPYPDGQQTRTIKGDNDSKIQKHEKLIRKNDKNEVYIQDYPRPWTNGHGFQYLPYGNSFADLNGAEQSESQEPVKNDVTTSPDINDFDKLPIDEKRKVINDDLAHKKLKNDQENEKDSKEIKYDDHPAIDVRTIDQDKHDINSKDAKNDNESKNDNHIQEEVNEKPEEHGRPIHIERPVKNDVTDDEKAGDENLHDDEEPLKEDTKNDKKADIEKIEDDPTISFRDFIVEDEKQNKARKKRDIDYSQMHDAPALPLFKRNQFPDYIKEILPSNDDLEIPAEIERSNFGSRSTEKPAYVSRTTEEPVYLTVRSEDARKPLYLSWTEKPAYMSKTTNKPENMKPKISTRIGESEEHKITKKSTRNVDEDIEKEISGVLRKIAEAQDSNTDVENPTSGINLIGDSGMVWNDLHGQHYRYNVGPDATNTEDHYAQIPIKPSTQKPVATTEEDTNAVDLSSEIVSALDEIGHIFEEVLNNQDAADKTTTENYDIHVNINKDNDVPKKIEREPIKDNNSENKGSELDSKKEIFNNDNEQPTNKEVKTKKIENVDDQVNLDQVMDFLHVIQDLVEKSQQNESNHQENEVKNEIIPHKDSNKDDETKSKGENKENSEVTDNIKEILNNENYWKWLKDTSESYMNIIMKRVLGLIKEEVAKQIQHLVFKMMEEQGITPPNENDGKQKDKNGGSTESKDKEGNGQEQMPKADDKYWDWLRDSSEAYINILMKRFQLSIRKGVANQIDSIATKMFTENGYTAPKKDKIIDEDNDEVSKVIQTLKGNDKWKWLTKSSDAYFDKIMEHVNQLIEEEVTRQVTHLVKFHMPSKNDEQTNAEEKPNKKEENPDKKEENLDENDDSEAKTDTKRSRKVKHQLDKSKDEVTDKKRKDKKKNKHENGDENEEKDEYNHDHENEHKHDDHEHKKKENNKAKEVKISATNTYGTSVNNDKVTNIFIFAVNGTDLKKIKPISSGNGIFVFGTDKDDEQNKDSGKATSETKEPIETTDNSNTDSKPHEDKVETNTAIPNKVEEASETISSDSNKEEKNKVTENKKNTEKDKEAEIESRKGEKTEDKPEKSPEDSKKTENDSENVDSKDGKEDEVVIDERIGEVDEPKEKGVKDSTESVKDTESTTTTESSSDKTR